MPAQPTVFGEARRRATENAYVAVVAAVIQVRQHCLPGHLALRPWRVRVDGDGNGNRGRGNAIGPLYRCVVDAKTMLRF